MTAKSAFTDEEWKTIAGGPPAAGLMVMAAQRGGLFRESLAMARAYTDARKEHGGSELLDELVSARPETHTARHGSPQELRDSALGELRQAVSLLESKATPEEVADYRRFVQEVAEHVAEAHREDGVEVSSAEHEAIEEIRQALGSS